MSEYQYNKVTPEMIEKFKEIAPKRVLVGDEINEDFTHDEMAIYGKARPEVLVEATSTEEVAAVVKLCNENKVPVTPSGARTSRRSRKYRWRCYDLSYKDEQDPWI